MAWYANFAGLLAQAQAPVDAAAPPEGMSPQLKLLIATGLIVGSLVLGNALANWLRMKDYAFKIALVLFTLTTSLAICFVGWPPKRGIDLSGGVVLIYEVDRSLSQPAWIPGALARLNESLNASGGQKLEAVPSGNDQIEITVPEGVDTARVDKAVTELRSTDLPLRQVSKRTEAGKTVFLFTADQQQKTLDMNKLIAAVGRRINPSGVKELTIRQFGADQVEIIVPEVEEHEVEQIKKRISTSGLLEFRIVANGHDDADVLRAAAKSAGRDVYIGGKLVGRWVQAGPDLNTPDGTFRDTEGRGREILVRMDPFDVDGRYLTRAASEIDNQSGGWAVSFNFDTMGAEKFRQLTSKNLPDPATGFHRKLGIILDNVMLSAPQINSTISSAGQITGRFTQEEVDSLVAVLNAGSLPASLRPEPIKQERISAQLGDDTIRQGTLSMAISTVAILIFMAVYYRFCGMVANLAVVLNVVVTVALMILIKAAFTLPGLAGLVLTVGMAVDANVLIYERMREELHRGASLRMAIRNGFGRAMSTIIDSHLTTLSTGVVLYIIGTDQIKGFAVTLVLGLLMSLYTAVFVSRVIIDIAEKHRWFTQAKMMQIIGHTNIDFIRWRGPAIAVSLLLILIGAVATFMRGSELLDIDFTGGSSVQILFAEGKPHDIAEVRKAVEVLPDVAVSSVGRGNLAFKVDTSEHDIKKVQAALREAFGDSLRTYAMTFDKPGVIEANTSGTNPAPGEMPAKSDDEKKTSQADPVATPPLAGDWRTSSLAALAVAQQPPAGDPSIEAQPTTPAPAAQPPATEPPVTEQPAAEKQEQVTPPTETPAKVETPAKSDTKAIEGPATSGTMVGGSRAKLNFPQEISHDPLQEMVETALKKLGHVNVPFELKNPKYQLGSDLRFNDWTLEILLDPTQTAQLLGDMQTTLAATPVFPDSNQIGGKVAGDTQMRALYAMLASMVIIAAYIWVRFQNIIFGLAAIVALVHDVAIAVGFLALSYYLSPFLGGLLVDPFKISLSVVAALLTIVGFSINDTIVVFDRIREVRGKSPNLTEDMINLSVNQTLSRTILTSGTVFIACIILYLVGGPGIHAFAYAMLVGVIAGTFSSIYIAAPILLWLKKPPAANNKAGGSLATASAKK